MFLGRGPVMVHAHHLVRVCVGGLVPEQERPTGVGAVLMRERDRAGHSATTGRGTRVLNPAGLCLTGRQPIAPLEAVLSVQLQ